jgi:hypothetical protein
MNRCRSCDADWEQGAWTPGCAECGGGALTQVCGMCFGTCGAVFDRAVMDSNDKRRAHWLGFCKSGQSVTVLLERFKVLLDALATPRGKELAELARAHAQPGSPELAVLRDWLSEQGLETGQAWLERVVRHAAARKVSIGTSLLEA